MAAAPRHRECCTWANQGEFWQPAILSMRFPAQPHLSYFTPPCRLWTLQRQGLGNAARGLRQCQHTLLVAAWLCGGRWTQLGVQLALHAGFSAGRLGAAATIPCALHCRRACSTCTTAAWCTGMSSLPTCSSRLGGNARRAPQHSAAQHGREALGGPPPISSKGQDMGGHPWLFSTGLLNCRCLTTTCPSFSS